MKEAGPKQPVQAREEAGAEQLAQVRKEARKKQAALDMIYLASCALHNIEPEKGQLDEIEWDVLYRTAKRQSMTAVVCMALEASHAFTKMEPALAKKWQDDKNKSIRKTVLMDEEWQKMKGFMESQGIWYMPLKGLVIKDLYPKYGMRQMADYDILFDPAGHEKLQAYMAGQGYERKDNKSNIHDAYYMDPVYNFELHWALFGDLHNPAWQNYYKNVKERLIPDKGSCYRFRDEDFYVYMTAHACKHYRSGGTGLRALMDCYVYCQKKGDALDWYSVRTELELLDLTEFEQMCRELAFCLFSEPNPYLTDTLTEKQRKAIEYFIGSGTYGTTEHRIENQLHALQRDEDAVSIKTKLHYLWRRLVPNMAWFRTFVPFCYRHKWAIPFFMIYRVLRGLTVRRKKLWREIQTLRKVR